MTSTALVPERDPAPAAADDGLARDSFSVARWTLVSRVTGFAKVATIAAVLGPTYFGNLFQSANLLPTVTYEAIGGLLFAALLVPALVRHIDADDPENTARIANGFLGVVVVALGATAALAAVASPLLVRILSLGVDDPSVGDAQYRTGVLLLTLLLPQVVLYGIAGTGAAVQNAHRRFALSAGAPALENIGTMLTLLLFALIYGTGADVADVTTEQLVFLGVGATSSVGLHAAAQWWGARRVGVTLIPTAGWRDDDVRRLLRLGLSALGYAVLNSARVFAILVVAGSVPGGVVAFQMAINFHHLPIALGAKPVAQALLPKLSRLHVGAPERLWDEYIRGRALSLFLIIPAAVGYLTLAFPLAEAVSFGEMATDVGVLLVAASIAALSLGMIGDAGLQVSLQASYARRDGSSPLRAVMLRSGLTLVGIVGAGLLADGTAMVVLMGLTVTIADLTASSFLDHRVRARLPRGSARLGPALWRAVVASAAMAVPTLLLVRLVPWVVGSTRVAAALTLALAIPVAIAVYVAVNRWMGSPELQASINEVLPRRRPRLSPDEGASPAASVAPELPAGAGPAPVPLVTDGSPPRSGGGRPPTPPAPDARPRARPRSTLAGLLVAGALLAVVAGPAAAAAPRNTLGGMLVVALFAGVVARPTLAAYVLIAATPLIVGIDRGVVLPLLRPNEVVLLLVVGALLARGAWVAIGRWSLDLHPNRIDIAVLLLAVFSSVFPVLWVLARGRELTLDDSLFATTLWKYFALYAVFRACIRTERQVRLCLVLSLVVACAVAVIAILQSLKLFGVPQFLTTYFAPLENENIVNINRGTSTIASAIGTADVMTFNLAIALTWLLRGNRHRLLLLGMSVLLAFGGLAAGQFSGAIGLVVGVVAVAAITGSLGRTYLASLPTLAAAGLALRPVIERRLSGFESSQGIPPSWAARLENLRTYFWPELFSDFNFLVGVRPAARAAAPEQWRDWVWIESGHTALLWTGGVPLLLAFFWFLWVALRHTAAVARARSDAIGVAAAASFAATVVIGVLMIFDPHLTLRGTADLAFPLLALSLTAGRPGPSAVQPARRSSPVPPVLYRPPAEELVMATSRGAP